MRLKILFFLIIVILFSSFASAITVPDGGVSYYNFSSTTDLWDGNDGTNNGATSVLDYPSFGVSGDSSPNSFSFDGSNDIVTMGNPDNLRPGTGDFSLHAWAKTSDSGNFATVIAMGSTGASGKKYLFFKDSTSDKFRCGGDDDTSDITLYSPSVINDNVWHNFVCTYDRDGDLVMYVDGVEVNRTDFSGASGALTDGGAFGVGAWAEGSIWYWNGSIDEVKFFNRSLSTTEVENLYNYGDVEGLQLTVNISSVYFDPNSSVFTDTVFNGEAVLNESLGTDEVVYYSYLRDTGNGTFSQLSNGTVSSLGVGNTAVFPDILTADTRQEYRFVVESTVINSSDTSQSFSATRNSSILTIQNRIPSLSNARLSPSPIINNSNFSGFVDASDADSDSLNISWNLYRNRTGTFTLLDSGTVTGVSPASNIELFTKSSSVTEEGDQFYFTSQATDSFNTSNVGTSSIEEVVVLDLWQFSFVNALNNSDVNNVTVVATNGSLTLTKQNETGNFIQFREDLDNITGNLTINVSSPNFVSRDGLFYNTGAFDVELYPVGFWFNATNKYDNSLLSGFNVTIDGNTYGTLGNALYVPLTGSYTYVWSKNGFFNQSGSVTYNVGANTTIESLESYQSIVRVNAVKKILNTSINTFSATDGTYNASTSSGTAILYLDAGSHTITGSATGYNDVSDSITTTNLENTSLTLQFGDASLNITAYDLIDEQNVSNFTATLEHSNGYSETLSTTSGLVTFGVITGENWSVTLSSDGFATENATIYQENQSQSYNFDLLPSNSINVSVFDEQLNSLLSEINPISLKLSNPGIPTYYFDLSEFDDLVLKDGEETVTGVTYATYFDSDSPFSDEDAGYKILDNVKVNTRTGNAVSPTNVKVTFTYLNGSTNEVSTSTASTSYTWLTLNNPAVNTGVTKVKVEFNNPGGSYSGYVNNVTVDYGGNPQFLTGISQGFYTLDFSADGYFPKSYFLNVTNTESLSLDAYLLNSSDSDNALTTFTVQDEFGNNLDDATLTFNRNYNGTLVSIGQVESDVSGEARIYLENSVGYQIVVQASGFSTRIVDLSCCNSQRSYTITLRETSALNFTTGGSGIYYNIVPSSDVLSSFPFFTSFTISNSDSSLEYWGLKFNNSEFVNVSGSPSGGTASLNLSLNLSYSDTFNVQYFWKKSGKSAVIINKSYRYTNISAQNSSAENVFNEFGDNLSPVFKVILATFISAVFVLLLVFTGFPALASGIIGFAIMGFFAFIEWINPFIYGFVVVLASFVWFTRGGR